MDINNRTINFTVNENSYQVSYPTIGQIFDMEANKSILSKGQLGSMLDSGTILAYNAIELIGIMAFFKTMCPNLIKDLKNGVERLEDLDAIDFDILRNIYKEQIKPWYDNWYKLYTKNNEIK